MSEELIWFAVPILLLVLGAFFLARSKSGQGDVYLRKARADIEEHGWHVAAVPGEKKPGFLCTIGLWETHQHPEILLFGTQKDPTGMAGALRDLVRRIESGETFGDGDRVEKAFGSLSGAVRHVLPEWVPAHLSQASTYYDARDFPVLQLYWPDAEGAFPWESAFDRELFGAQAVLYQSNPILAGLEFDQLQSLETSRVGGLSLDSASSELFLSPESFADRDLLEFWRWKTGPQTKVVKLTVFGDLLLQAPNGTFSWLETAGNTLVELGSDSSRVFRSIYENPGMFFHASVLLDLRDRDSTLEDGYVYDWIQEPMVGGEYSADNAQQVLLSVHLDATGQLAKKLEFPDVAPEEMEDSVQV